jgi:enoyl-CoA hydratase
MADSASTARAIPHSPCFEVSIEEKIAHIRLSRPEKMNSMIAEFWSDLPAIINAIDRQAAARVIVISSTGKHFSSGMDVSVLSGGGLSADESDPHIAAEAFLAKVGALQDSFTSLERCRIPVLCAIQGGVIGGAVDMVTAADCRWATRDAFFQIQEINIAMVADVGTFPRIQRLVPDGVVREMAFTGRRMGAEEALQRGLVNGLFETHEACVEGVLETARMIAAKDPLAVRGTKHILNYGREHSTADTLQQVALWNASMLPPRRMMEAFAANAEKRPAAFSDLRPVPEKPL